MYLKHWLHQFILEKLITSGMIYQIVPITILIKHFHRWLSLVKTNKKSCFVKTFGRKN